MRYYLSCKETNAMHTKFRLLDKQAINCGEITILTADLSEFLTNNWRGNIAWNNNLPDSLMNAAEEPK